MRHDCFWWKDLEIARLNLSGGAIVTASWCESIAKHVLPSQCAELMFTKYNGIHDYFLLGFKDSVENFVESLFFRIKINGMKSSNERAHFAFEEHAEAMGMKRKGLWQSHPMAISYVHFTLYRWRLQRLEFSGKFLPGFDETALVHDTEDSYRSCCGGCNREVCFQQLSNGG